MYRHILIATDGSERSARAVEHGVRLARAVGAKVSILTVTESLQVLSLDAELSEDSRKVVVERTKERAEQTLATATDIARASGVSVEAIQREGDRPHEIILEVAEARRCDLIVMASHGRSGFSAMFMGSETMKLLAHTRRPVLVVR